MPPEQWLGKPVDLKSDIYSFGCMFYEMLAGRLPFDGKRPEDLMIEHLEKEPRQISNIPRNLNDIVLKCLAKKPEERFINFEKLGNSILQIGMLPKEIKNIPQLVKTGRRPLSSEDLTQKGFGFLHLRRDREAIQYFQKAVDLNPSNYAALGYIGYCYGNLKEHVKAIEVCEKAIKINPRFGHAYGNLGYSYSEIKQFEKAIENYVKAIQLEPLVVNYNNMVIAYTSWGDYENNPEKYKEGIRFADLGLKIDRNYYRLWINRGVCFEKLGQYKDAVDSFDKALSISPRAYQAVTGLYRCHLALGNHKEAEQFLRLASGIDQNFTT